MRQPTARTWAILDAAHRLAQAEGTTTEMVLAMVAEDQESRGAAAPAECAVSPQPAGRQPEA